MFFTPPNTKSITSQINMIRKKRSPARKVISDIPVYTLVIPLDKQYSNPKWRKKRSHILKRDGFKCRLCKNDKSILHVHHKKYIGPYIWDTPDKYLITLCAKCHEKKHNGNRNKKKVRKNPVKSLASKQSKKPVYKPRSESQLASDLIMIEQARKDGIII